MPEKMKVTPWEVSGNVDYEKLMREFGIRKMPNLPEVFMKNVLFRRGTFFGQRDFEQILEAIKNKRHFVMMTWMMPSP